MRPTKCRFVSISSLQKIGALATPAEKINEALYLNYFPLAALLTVRSKAPEGIARMNQIIRGLTLFDPRLTPLNLKTLTVLKESFPTEFALSRIDKMRLTRTLINYGDADLLAAMLNYLALPPHELPISSIVNLLEFAKLSHNAYLAQFLYTTLKRTYPFTYKNNTSCMVLLMQILANSNKYRHISTEVANDALPNCYNASIALSIARVAYKTNDEKLRTELQTRLLKLPKEVQDVINIETAANPQADFDLDNMNPVDAGSYIKKTAETDLDRAKELLESVENEETQFIGVVALCNQYINKCDKESFAHTYALLNKVWPNRNIVLNLALKWELKYGDFESAKKQYMRARRGPLKQRVIALNCLALMDGADRDWIEIERRQLQ